MKRANAREKRREVAVDVSSHQNLGRHRQTAREQRRVVAFVAVRGALLLFRCRQGLVIIRWGTRYIYTT